MAPIVVAVIAILWIGAGYCLVALPRWYFRSISRYRLWHLRDELVDDILVGKLPGEHPAVLQLLNRAETAIALISRFSLVDVLLLVRLIRRASPAARAALSNHSALCDRAGLDHNERRLLDSYTELLDFRVASTMFSSSWFGLAYLLVKTPRIVAAVRRNEKAPAGASFDTEGFVVSAADRVTEITPLGHSAKEAVGTFLNRRLVAPL